MCKTPVNLSFSQNKWGKHNELATTIQVENLKVFYISNDETDLIIGFITWNLVAQEKIIEFRDSQNFTFFEATGVGRHMANHVGDTWKAMCHNAWQRPMHVGHVASHVCNRKP